MNYNQAVEYLFGLRKFGSEPGVVREKEALRRLGNPEEQLNIIHVAGTNGKGSVCAYTEAILRGQGYSTGLFTSPHLVRVNERIQLNAVPVSDEQFMEAFTRVYEVSSQLQKEGLFTLAFFDFLMAMAMLIFAQNKTDYVILETGLGGRLDCTSAVSQPRLTVITSIGLDHTEILGDTVEQIAMEKAGIIRENVPLVYLADDDRVRRVIAESAEKKQIMAYPVTKKDYVVIKSDIKHIDFSFNNRYYKNSLFQICTTARYQVENCAVALSVVPVLDKEKCFDEESIHSALLHARWRGRMEEVRQGFFVDGAHNPDGVQAFLQTAEVFEGRRYLLFSAVCEKDYDGMIQQICKSNLFDGYMIVRLGSYRALEPSVIAGEFMKYTDKPVALMPDMQTAVAQSLKYADEGMTVFATGSLYLVGEIMEEIMHD